ncbi:hypothetical protein [Frondihabitans cladoniiphilus]|uniref:Tfp pilus assembly protein PilN n=1 Tax=Frondihabitans cladoniiphilus TaxID=715785 RepID=A0ABP8VYZ2_9MICO
MKFYLTKAAQRAAESGQPVEKKERVAKAPKAAAMPSIAREAKPSRPAKPAKLDKPVKADTAPRPGTPVLFDRPQAPQAAAVAAAPRVEKAPKAPRAEKAPRAAKVAKSASAPAEEKFGTVKVARVAREPKADRAPKVKAPPKPHSKVLAIGGEARVDLLPAEVRAERHAGVKVRRAWLGVVAVVVLAGIATGAATLYSQKATDALTAVQGQTSTLSTEAAKYTPVKTLQSKVDLATAARTVGGSTDIDWPTYLAKVEATLPAGMALSAVTIDSASPIASYAQATGPLQGQRVATLQFTATSSTLPSVPTWLTNLSTLPGFADAAPGTVTLSGTTYTSSVTLHINKKAFSHAYAKKAK